MVASRIVKISFGADLVNERSEVGEKEVRVGVINLESRPCSLVTSWTGFS